MAIFRFTMPSDNSLSPWEYSNPHKWRICDAWSRSRKGQSFGSAFTVSQQNCGQKWTTLYDSSGSQERRCFWEQILSIGAAFLMFLLEIWWQKIVLRGWKRCFKSQEEAVESSLNPAPPAPCLGPGPRLAKGCTMLSKNLSCLYPFPPYALWEKIRCSKLLGKSSGSVVQGKAEGEMLELQKTQFNICLILILLVKPLAGWVTGFLRALVCFGVLSSYPSVNTGVGTLFSGWGVFKVRYCNAISDAKSTS